jgi:hypothetical protein
MPNSRRPLLGCLCAAGLLALAGPGPLAAQEASPEPLEAQGPGAAGYELQEALRQQLAEQSKAAEEAEILGLPLVSVTASDPTAAEPADPAAFTLTRSGSPFGALRVRYVVRGDATGGADYLALPGWAEIPDGETSVTVRVTVFDDRQPEPLERVSLEVIPDEMYVVGTPRTALVRIADDDGLAPQALAAAAPQLRHAVDVSHWSGSGWSAECFVENGVTHLIAGTQNPTITRAQLDAAVAAGMTVDAYVYLYWGSSITAQVQDALSTIQGYPIIRLWLDAENSASGYSSSQILQKIQEGLDACGSTPCGIYTAKWWWDPSTTYATAFADVPLWYARYDLNPDFNDWYSGVSAFGGWSDPTGKQYRGSHYFCGVNVDRNIMAVGPAPTAPFAGETGRVTTNQASASTWHAIAFENAYVAPVVIMQPLSDNGGDPTTVRLRNVRSTGFEWQMDEWDYRDGAHTTETVAYLAVESGLFELEDGTRVEAGTVSVDHGFAPVVFAQPFPQTPVILSQAQTAGDPAAVVTRQRSASASGFEVQLQEQEANDPVHGLETVGYLAIAPGPGMTGGVAFEADLTADAVTHAWHTLAFSDSYSDPVFLAGLQTRDGGDTAGLRYRNLGSTAVEVFVEEEKSRDTEVNHTTEVVGYLVFDHPGSLNDGGQTPPPAPTGLSPDGGQEFPNGAAVAMSSNPIPDATRYEFAIEHDSGGGAWATYYTYTSTTSSFTFWPQYEDRQYRFRMRAENAFGWGPSSPWATFVVGDVGGDDPPPAPTGLSPDGGQEFPNGAAVTMSSNPIEGATQYEFAIEHDSGGGAWATYWTYTSTTSSFTFWPQYDDREYRFRMRAENAFGWGAYSTWATFVVGHVGSDDPPPAPTGLSPDGGQVYPAGGAVVMSCAPLSSATQYEFAIEYLSGGNWATYYAYTTSGSSKTFYPVVHGTDYRFRVRASNVYGWGPYSAWAWFHVAN